MKIFFVGMPGCGKSTLAREVAPLLDIQFVDLDELIVEKEKKTIKEIFSEDGENYFRKIESEILKEFTCANDRFLMATGGGAPCFFDNMEFIKNNGVCVFLDVPVEILAQRLFMTELEDRPLLKDLHLNTAIQELEKKLNSRIDFYNQSHIKLSGGTIRKDNAANIIKSYFRDFKS